MQDTRNLRAAGVIFDLDGTLVDSRADLAAAANAVRRRWGRPPLPDAVVLRYVGDGTRALLHRVLGHVDDPASPPGPPDAATVERAYAVFAEVYGDHLLDRTRPYPGVVETLAALADRPLFVATNKPRAFTLAILAGLGLADRFVRVVAGDDLGNRKPHPDHLRACLDGSDLAPSACAMVGDSANDIVPARTLGMRSVAVTWGFVDEDALRAAGPDVLARDAAALRAALGAAHQA